MELSYEPFLVIKYSIVDSVIKAFPFSLKSYNTNRIVLTTASLFWFNKKRLLLPVWDHSNVT